VKCTGSVNASRPTIVLLPGATKPLTTFVFIQNHLSGVTRVCSYDRPGEGTSSRPRVKQTLADSAAILHAVLARLDVAAHGIVLVGHSLGGLVAANYASQYRGTHQVRALVLLDATPPGLTESVLRLIPPDARGPAAQFRSWVAGFASGEDQERLVLTGAAVSSIGDVPLIVARHGRPIFADLSGYGRQLEEIWWQDQRAWLRLSPLSHLVVARKSGHAIYLDQPFLTLRLIRQALAEAR
jgi:pimeloyl-ACP methyl ester carboxylesterase